MNIKTVSLMLMVFLFFLALPVSAHQPRLVKDTEIEIIDPEISKAYYGELSGSAHTYTIRTNKSFNLYVGILVPKNENSKKDVKAEVIRDDEIIETIGGSEAEWSAYFEPFGQSSYWAGGEYKTKAQAGEYTIRVSSTNNSSKYSLAIGEIEAFDSAESLNALNLIPVLKRDFFDESPISFIRSPFGWGLIVLMYILAFICGLTYRAILKKFAKGSTRGIQKNIGKNDRLIRLAIASGLLLWAITTSWSPILLFFSGFALFEAIFSWCGFYAAIGRNSCPI
jgi:Protein of unknown function (DUF2892)